MIKLIKQEICFQIFIVRKKKMIISEESNENKKYKSLSIGTGKRLD